MEWFNKWLDTLYNTFIVDARYKTLISGFEKTIVITLGALALGVIIGTIVAVIKVFADGNKKLRPLDFLCNIYLTVIRGTPVVVQLLISFFIIFISAKDGTWVAIIAFGINSGAYVAETIRSGIMAVDNGQMEAGRSLGLNYVKTMRYIIIPQAIKNIMPALSNELIVLVKETAVIGYIAKIDFTAMALKVQSVTYDYITPLLTIAVGYYVVLKLLAWGLNSIEKALRKSDVR